MLRVIKILMKWGFVLGLWALLFFGIVIAWFAQELPTITAQMVFERRPTITILANDGTVIDRYGDIKGEVVSAAELPPHVVQAVLATEDRRFYHHFGIDPIGVLRALVVNIVKGGYVQGGSTITQQLAKNLFLSRDRTLKRKIQEAMLAVWLETKLSKDDILSAYLNRVYLGAGAYGIDAAAHVYYNKSAKELTLREAATLAGLLKAPSRYAPNSNPSLAAKRTRVVLAAMKDAGYISEQEFEKLNKLPPAPPRKPSSGDTARYFADYIVDQVEGLVGIPEEDIVVETTLDRDIQNTAESAITQTLLENGTASKVSQGAAVVLSLDGAIVAMIGGKNYSLSEYNRATESLRSPGSSFKPFVYLAALENGWNPNSTIVDEPVRIGKYSPQNYGNEYYGEVTLTQALTRSLNTVAVRLAQDVGPESIISVARRLGINAQLEPNLSLALGSNGVPMIEMVTAYASLGRGGVAVEPFGIHRILNKKADVLYEHPTEQVARQVIPRGYVEQLSGMMRSVIEHGTGTGARIPYPAAGKTGTSQDFRDAWFIGFTRNYATAVWVGNDDNSPMKRVTGGSLPASIWRNIMTAAMSKSPQTYYTVTTTETNFSFSDLINRLTGMGDMTGAPSIQEEPNAPQKIPSKSQGHATDPKDLHIND